MTDQLLDPSAGVVDPLTVATADPADGPRAGVPETEKGHRGLAHIGALDGLRGVAVLAVLVYHGGHLKGGYLGVDLFFVLSGYLITSLLLTEWRGSGTVRLGNFWARRARRLFPALAVVLLAVAAYAWLVADPTVLDRIRTDGLATLFYFANWHDIIAGHNYGDQFSAQSPLLHTWSLAIEEQFYVLWPLLVVGLLRWRNRPSTILRASVIVAGGAVALMLGLYLAGVSPDPTLYEATYTRIGAIAMGAALAAWQIRHGHTRDASRRITLEVSAMGAIVFLGCMWALTDITTGFLFTGGLALCGLAVTVVIATATHPDPIGITKLLSFAPLRWVGLISYGLYLWHWPIYLYLTPNRTGLSGWSLFGLQLFVAIDVATLSYFVLERPIRYGALRGIAARVAVPGAAAVAVVALLLSTTGGVTAGGGFAGKKTDTRLVGAPRGTTEVMVVGDSVGYGLAVEGLTPLHDRLHIAVSNNAYVGCNLLLALGTVRNANGRVQQAPGSIDCAPKWVTPLVQIRPDVVLMVFGAYPGISVQIGGTQYTQCQSIFRQAYRGRLEQQAKVLMSTGATLVITTVPTLDNGFVRQQVPDLDQRIHCTNDDIRAVARSNPRKIKVIDLAGFVCPRDKCRVKVNGFMLREDSLHFKGPGAKYITRWLVPRALADARRSG